MKYDIVYADPPWKNKKSGKGARNNDKHYPYMETKDICALPISEMCSDRYILFMWAVFPCLPDALQVMDAWGFDYYGLGFDWLKTTKDGAKPKIGTGYYTRQNNEVCLIGMRKRVKDKIKPMVRNVSCAIVEPPREHSRKPDCVRDLIVKICGDLPRIELFARETVDGWDAWGNETTKFNEG